MLDICAKFRDDMTYVMPCEEKKKTVASHRSSQILFHNKILHICRILGHVCCQSFSDFF